MKKCSMCLMVKDLAEFSINKNNKSGYHSYCKVCIAERNKDRYSLEAYQNDLYAIADMTDTHPDLNIWIKRLNDLYIGDAFVSETLVILRSKDFLSANNRPCVPQYTIIRQGIASDLMRLRVCLKELIGVTVRGSIVIDYEYSLYACKKEDAVL